MLYTDSKLPRVAQRDSVHYKCVYDHIMIIFLVLDDDDDCLVIFVSEWTSGDWCVHVTVSVCVCVCVWGGGGGGAWLLFDRR